MRRQTPPPLLFSGFFVKYADLEFSLYEFSADTPILLLFQIPARSMSATKKCHDRESASLNWDSTTRMGTPKLPVLYQIMGYARQL